MQIPVRQQFFHQIRNTNNTFFVTQSQRNKNVTHNKGILWYDEQKGGYQMKIKQILCSVFSACMMVTAIPFSAKAETLPIWAYDFSKQTTDISGDGFTWDADSKILSLDGLSVTIPKNVNENGAAIRLPKDSVIYLDSDSEIFVEGYGCHAIYAAGDLTIRGGKKLTLTTSNSTADTIHVYRGDINIEDGVTIEAYPSGSALYVDEARGSDGVVNIIGSAKVEIYDPYDDNFYARDLDKLVRIIYHHPIKPSDVWLNFDKTYKKDDKMVLLTKKTTKESEKQETQQTSEKQETQKPETPKTHNYTLKIGDTAIYKDEKLAAHSDAAPYLSEKGYTMLPLRALLTVFEPDTKIDWNVQTKTATLYFGKNNAVITENSETMIVNGEPVKMAQPAQTNDKRFFLSLRDWTKLMGVSSETLQWNNTDKEVTLTY